MRDVSTLIVYWKQQKVPKVQMEHPEWLPTGLKTLDAIPLERLKYSISKWTDKANRSAWYKCSILHIYCGERQMATHLELLKTGNKVGPLVDNYSTARYLAVLSTYIEKYWHFVYTVSLWLAHASEWGSLIQKRATWDVWMLGSCHFRRR